MQIAKVETFMGQIVSVHVGDGEYDTWARIAPHDWVVLEGFGDYSQVAQLEALYAEYLQK